MKKLTRKKRFITYLLLFLLMVLTTAWLKMEFFIEKFIFQPTELRQDYTYQFEKNCEELYLQPEKGVSLNALYFKASANPRGTILYFHGNRGNLVRWGEIASELARYNYDVMVMDYRGYGKSVGERTEEKLYSDAMLWHQYLEKNYQPKEIIIFGRSLGTGIASYVAAQTNPKKLILETPYYSMSDMAKRYVPFLPLEKKVRFKLLSYQYLKQVGCPIIFFHGTDDSVVPYEAGQTLFNSIQPNPKATFITFKDGKHNNLSEYDLYWEKLNEFMKE